jgi:hypothetical protein
MQSVLVVVEAVVHLLKQEVVEALVGFLLAGLMLPILAL